MKNLLTASAALEIGAGVSLLGLPSATAALLIGAPLQTPVSLIVGRVGGAGLLALGVACWLARRDARSLAARGVVAAMSVYNVAACAVLAYAGIGYGLHGVALWPVAVLHAVMGVWCATSLVTRAATS
jgi:hypothetical protein